MMLFSGVSNTTLTSCSGIASGAGTFFGLAISTLKLVLESTARGVGMAYNFFSGVGRSIPAVLACTGSTVITHLSTCEKSKGGGILIASFGVTTYWRSINT